MSATGNTVTSAGGGNTAQYLHISDRYIINIINIIYTSYHLIHTFMLIHMMYVFMMFYFSIKTLS